MQRVYKSSLETLLPYIQKLQEEVEQAPEKRKEFMLYLHECIDILNNVRGNPLPQGVTMQHLDQANKFISQVVQTYSDFLVKKFSSRQRGKAADVPKSSFFVHLVSLCIETYSH